MSQFARRRLAVGSTGKRSVLLKFPAIPGNVRTSGIEAGKDRRQTRADVVSIDRNRQR